jgi:ribosomal protein L25 (general stress protein Ctc)
MNSTSSTLTEVFLVVPAVVYGYGTKNTSVKVDEVEFIKVIREVGRNGVFVYLDG